MKEVIQELLRQSSLTLIILGATLSFFGAVTRVKVAGVAVEIPDIAGRIIVLVTGLALFLLGLTWKRNGGERAQPKHEPRPQSPTLSQALRNEEMLLASILEDLRDNAIPPYVKGITIEKSITLGKCPQMEAGWMPSEVELDHRQGEFRLPSELTEAYERYYEESYKKKHGAGSDETIMLVQIPRVGSDRPGLRLTTQSNRYSYSQFYWNVALLDEDRYNQVLTDLFAQERISFPHNLCMHLVVLTSDDHLLVTLRSRNVGTYPDTWSCSIEENLRPEDLKGDRQTTVNRWITRALLEELGVKSDYCVDLKVLSIFLEGTRRLNISLVGHAVLDLDRNELSRRIDMIPRSDYEFSEHGYMSLEKAARELRYPTRLYHPTSRYRMLMALLHRYGEPNFARQYINLVRQDAPANR